MTRQPSDAADEPGMRKWLVFVSVSLAFFFLNLATFTSLGVVLYTMVGELNWSLTAAGFSFTLLGIGCGVFSPAAAVVMRWIGARLTICLGAALLVAGFLAAARCHGVTAFYVGMTLVGAGYAFGGNVPGVCLLAVWFRAGTARIVGFYYMLGALGAAFGPPIVHVIVASGGWRGHWRLMAYLAAALGLLCWLLVRDDAPGVTGQGSRGLVDAPRAWTDRQAILTWPFLLVAGAMTATMFAITTLNSVATLHFVRLGATPGAAALVLSCVGLSGTLVKGLAGRICEAVTSTTVLAVGMVAQAIGCLLLGIAATPILQYASAIIFGLGWGAAYVSATVVLLDCFGPVVGARILSVVWFITTLAAAGPLAAGMIADRSGSYALIFNVFAGMFLLLALPIVLMRVPAGGRRAPSLAG